MKFLFWRFFKRYKFSVKENLGSAAEPVRVFTVGKYKSEPERHVNGEISSAEWKENSRATETSFEYEKENEKGSSFEEAIKATKYGKYNWFLLSIGLWGYMSAMYSTTTMSLILPAASCDYDLTNFDKGVLNAVVYVGMTLTAFFWGLVSDVVGRKVILLTGFAVDAAFCVLIGLAQSYSFLLVIKLLSGFFNSSLLAITTTFVAESHANEYRASVTIGMGVFSSVANVVLPLSAWIIIPLPIHWAFLNGYIYLPSWRVFLIISAFPSVLAFISLLFSDESPKFLTFQNRNEEALNVLRRIYAMNTGKPRDMYPIKCLKLDPNYDAMKLGGKNFSFRQIMSIGWKQVEPIFHQPYLWMVFLLCAIQFCIITGMNAIRLWSPQLFALALEHETAQDSSATASNICDLFAQESIVNITGHGGEDCSEKMVDDEIYLDAMITGVVTGIGYLICGYVVTMLERKLLLFIIYGLSLLCSFALYYSVSSNYLLAVVSVFIAFTMSAASTITSVVVDTFPTFLRTTALSLCLCSGRFGGMIGNLIFPVLLDWNCTSSFVFIGASLLAAAGLTLFLPKIREEQLK